MREIYCLSKGEYSDYTVLAAFEDRNTAETWCKTMNEGDGRGYREIRIENLCLVSAGESPSKVTVHHYRADLMDDGRVVDTKQYAITDWAIEAWEQPPLRPKVRYVRTPVHNDRGGRLEVTGSSAESVAKVAGEKIMMWKAGAWGGPKHEEIIEGGDNAPTT